MKSIFIFSCLLPLAFMACDNLTGTWTNELNSTMIIQHRYDGLLGGNFGSKVESSAGLAGNFPMDLYGRWQDEMISLVVHYPKSIATHVGQCYDIDGETILKTTWVLHSKTENVGDDWMSKRIGSNVFKLNP